MIENTNSPCSHSTYPCLKKGYIDEDVVYLFLDPHICVVVKSNRDRYRTGEVSTNGCAESLEDYDEEITIRNKK